MKKETISLEKFSDAQIRENSEAITTTGGRITKSWEDYHTNADSPDIGDHSLDTRVADYCWSI